MDSRIVRPPQGRTAVLLAAALWLAGAVAGQASVAAVSAGAPAPLRDPALDALIASALRSGPVVAARVSEVAAAGHEVQAARWQYAPTVSTQLQAGTGSAGGYASVLRADQRLYAGGRLDADLGGAVARRESATLAVQETSLAVALQLVGDWRALQAALGQQQASLAYRARLDALEGTISRRIANGVSPPIEQALLNARLVQSQNDLAAARSAADTARAALLRLAGDRPIDAAAPPASGALPPAPALCAPTEAGEQDLRAAIDQHPAVRRNALDLEAARFAVEGQRAATRPSVTLRLEQPIGATVAGSSREPRLSVVFEYSTDARLAGASRADAGAERLNGLADQALALRREVRQQIAAECADYASTLQRVGGYADVQGYNNDVLASYTRLFVAGKRGWLDLLNAARESFDSEQAALATQAALRASHYRLALLSGEYPLPAPGATGEMAAAVPLRASQPAPSAPAAATAPPQSAGLADRPIELPPAGPASAVALKLTPSADGGSVAEPTEAADPAAAEAARALVERWADAWRRKDVAAYLACYTNDFGGAAHDTWAQQRSARIQARRRIDLQLAELQFGDVGQGSEGSPGPLRASFLQSYTGDGHRELSRKQLLLRRVDGEWRIADEREQP